MSLQHRNEINELKARIESLERSVVQLQSFRIDENNKAMEQVIKRETLKLKKSNG